MQKNTRLTREWDLLTKYCLYVEAGVFSKYRTQKLSSTVYVASANASKTLKESTGIKGPITNATKINIVLVHGIGFDGSSWSKVISILQNAGYKVTAAQLPLHSLADDVATVKRAIDFIGGPVILVGHSYGGVVITNAAYNNLNVKGLVYVAAIAPQEGQSISSFLSPAKLPKGLSVMVGGGFAYANTTLYHDWLAQDVDQAQAKIMAAVQKPVNLSIFAEKSGPPAWKQLPTWYQVSENDRVLPPALQHLFAKQMNATTISLTSSHASLVSHPREIAQLILNATKAVTK
ncbi:MAG: alpha/beta hydrolase [Candidatus Nitrosopolaris sp.]